MHPVKVDDLVHVLRENISPKKWPLARVTQAHPGSCGQIRPVSLKTATGKLTRPVVKFIKLHINVLGSSTQIAVSL